MAHRSFALEGDIYRLLQYIYPVYLVTHKSIFLFCFQSESIIWVSKKTTSVNLSPSTHLPRITPGKLFLLWTPRQQLKTHLLIQ